MTAELINLSQVRKARERDRKAREAAENRVRFGLSKAEKDARALDAEQRSRLLDGKKLEDPDPRGEGA
jgi:hypothetical protein